MECKEPGWVDEEAEQKDAEYDAASDPLMTPGPRRHRSVDEEEPLDGHRDGQENAGRTGAGTDGEVGVHFEESPAGVVGVVTPPDSVDSEEEQSYPVGHRQSSQIGVWGFGEIVRHQDEEVEQAQDHSQTGYDRNQDGVTDTLGFTQCCHCACVVYCFVSGSCGGN